ncbi:hypothetical protein PRUPE_5G070900 [Prunus persica]|uniref:Uncharacterized protein n=1 Tax=Prunus persica TaxID=3760 RepID=A0A251P8E1_PRUPE|nr:hypothetical protein PRUPE_5G070900 [Prunus persica]
MASDLDGGWGVRVGMASVSDVGFVYSSTSLRPFLSFPLSNSSLLFSSPFLSFHFLSFPLFYFSLSIYTGDLSVIWLFASLAGKDVDSETKVKSIEADLKILKLQERAMSLAPSFHPSYSTVGGSSVKIFFQSLHLRD